MKKLFITIAILLSFSVSAETSFDDMLQAAKTGDRMARVVVAYSYYFGEFRDGTKVEKNLNKAYAWASLANYQGEPEAKKLVNAIIPILKSRALAEHLAGEYFNQYGVTENNLTK